MNERELLKVREKIDKAKSEISEDKGQLKAIKQEFKKWGCDSIDQMQEKVEELKEQRDKYEKEMQEKIKELEDNYDL